MDNPYQSPLTEGERLPSPLPADWSTALLAWWPVLLAVNLVVPLALGWSMLEARGKLGVAVAVAMFAVAGWLLCLFVPQVARRLMVGSIFVAASQLIPVLQLVLGIFAFAIAVQFGHAITGDDIAEASQITTEIGGFLVTTIVGTGLAVCSLSIGVVDLAIRDAMQKSRT